MHLAAYAERRIATPQEWNEVEIRSFCVKLTDGTTVRTPRNYSILVADRYAVFEDNSPVSLRTQEQSAAFLGEHNEVYGTDFILPPLFMDEQIRSQHARNESVEKGHPMFDENFGRFTPSISGYVADFTRPHRALKPEEGIDGQMLTHKEGGWRLGREIVYGPVTIAPPGMVPLITAEWVEKRYGKRNGAKTLRRLEELGVVIPDNPRQRFTPVNGLGYPQFTLDHEETDKNGRLISHSHHLHPPSQRYGETVGIRGVPWNHHRGRRCFCIHLNVSPEASRPYWSFPLVRAGNAIIEITPPTRIRRISMAKPEETEIRP